MENKQAAQVVEQLRKLVKTEAGTHTEREAAQRELKEIEQSLGKLLEIESITDLCLADFVH